MAAARARTPGTPTTAKPRSDVYVGLLVLALLAQVAGAAFLYLDWSQYPDSKPPQVQARPKGTPAPAGGGPVQPAGVGGGAPPGGMGGGPPPGGMAGGPPPGGMGGGPPPGGMAGGRPPGAMMGGKAPGAP